MKKFYLLTLGLSLTVGCALGIKVGTTVLDGLGWLNSMSAGSAASDYAFGQYLHTNHESARKALIFAVTFLDDLGTLYPDKTLKFDLALSYARLALVEEAAGNREQSKAYFQKARDRLMARSKVQKSYSEDDVRQILQRFDRP